MEPLAEGINLDVLETRSFAELGLDDKVLGKLTLSHGPLAIVDLETTGLADDFTSEILEFGVVAIDPGSQRALTAGCLLKPSKSLPRAVARLTGLKDADLAESPVLENVSEYFRTLLLDRVLIAHNAEFERSFLTRFLDERFSSSKFLDTLDLLAVTHPDAPDLRLESFTRLLLGREEEHRALSDALDTARVISKTGIGARKGEERFIQARESLSRFFPGSPWLPLLEEPQRVIHKGDVRGPYIEIGTTLEEPVVFNEECIVAALADQDRGKRHFPGYHVRSEQIELVRRVVSNLESEEICLLEGGTGIGKSLAYLSALIPFAVMREKGGEHRPLIISTRTKLLQDQLLDKDIAATARFLGYPNLRALSIKGRGNYACQRGLNWVLQEGASPSLFADDRQAFAILEASARIRTDGELSSMPSALLRRYPAMRDAVRRSVSTRAEHCSREQCASRSDCAFGRKRRALAKAHILVANHDLLLRWPPDYPAFEHVVADEVHELADVADEAFALTVSPEFIEDCLEDLFGRSSQIGGRGSRSVSAGLLPARVRRKLDRDAKRFRKELHLELISLGRSLESNASEFGELECTPGFIFKEEVARGIVETFSKRLHTFVSEVEALILPEEELGLVKIFDELRLQADALDSAFDSSEDDTVARFERLGSPHDRWRLIVRQISPADLFHERFLDRVHSFTGVSASLFIGGDAMASLGDLQLEPRAGDRLQRFSVPSPFDYRKQMRAAALQDPNSLVEQTARVLEDVALRLGGRTLGLFTSLHRMNQVAEELTPRLREVGIDVLMPRRGSDDPGALVTRFQNGAAVLLGARKFWQGLDISGTALQAVVIEKLPFEVPSELRKRREKRLEIQGVSSFQRVTLGRMLLNLKQMTGRLIRSEGDRGLVVVVEGRVEKGYFGQLSEALPEGVEWSVTRREDLLSLIDEVGILDDF